MRVPLFMLLAFSFIYLLSAGQLYWSMLPFSDQVNSSCFDCSFLNDVLIHALVLTVLVAFGFWVTRKIKSIVLQLSIQFIGLFLLLFIANLSIFGTWEASWSTYSFSAQIVTVSSLAFWPILGLCVLSLFASYFDYVRRLGTSWKH